MTNEKIMIVDDDLDMFRSSRSLPGKRRFYCNEDS